MSWNYRCVRFVNLSMSSLGVFSDESSTFLDMMNDIGIDKKQQRSIIKKMINIAIRATYYIFCCRNRNWDSTDLMQFWIFFVFWLLFCVWSWFWFFFFLIIQSQAAFLNCLHVARFTIVHSKTQIKFPLLLLYFFYGNDRFFSPTVPALIFWACATCGGSHWTDSIYWPAVIARKQTPLYYIKAAA